MQTLRIVFMGTPDFAVPCLQTLLESPHSVVGVFTQPDKPQGRKMVLTPPPVKVRAGFSAGEDERPGYFGAVKEFGAGFDRGGGIRAHFAPGGIGIAQVWLYQCARLAAA